MNKISKLVGFITITVQGQDIPVKFGMHAFTSFTDHYGIELSEVVEKLFKWITIKRENEEGEEVEIEKLIPIKPFEVASVMLWAGANYVNIFDGGPGIRIIDASNWIDELGGINSDAMHPVYNAFWKAYKNGGTPPPEPLFETEEQKKSEPVPEG